MVKSIDYHCIGIRLVRGMLGSDIRTWDNQVDNKGSHTNKGKDETNSRPSKELYKPEEIRSRVWGRWQGIH